MHKLIADINCSDRNAVHIPVQNVEESGKVYLTISSCTSCSFPDNRRTSLFSCCALSVTCCFNFSTVSISPSKPKIKLQILHLQ